MKRLSLKILVLLTISIFLSSCSDYWWNRGQPESSATLLAKSQDRYASAATAHANKRPDIAADFNSLQKKLLSAVTSVNKNDSSKAQNLNDVKNSFIALEGKLSVGSRAAYGELSGQLRSFVEKTEKGEDVQASAFSLFAARTIFFMSREIATPGPTFG